jgi:hypothetical protein
MLATISIPSSISAGDPAGTVAKDLGNSMVCNTPELTLNEASQIWDAYNTLNQVSPPDPAPKKSKVVPQPFVVTCDRIHAGTGVCETVRLVSGSIREITPRKCPVGSPKFLVKE